MGTISLGLAVREAAGRSFGILRSVGAVLGAAAVTVLDWQRRARERRMLLGLDARMLRDVGLTPADAEREARKPFWIQ